LQFGNDFARRIYHNHLIELYPEHVSYNIWRKRFFDFQGPFARSEIDDFLLDSNPICLLRTVPLPYKGQPAVEIIEKNGQAIPYQFLGFKDHSLANKKGEK
jgi:hypothetical protein